MKLQDRASFYQILHRGIKSGLTLQQVLAAGLLPPSCEAVVPRLQQEIEKGASLTRIFTVTGIVSSWEADILNIGETSGRLEAVLSRLDNYFTQKVSQLRQLKSKLIYPLLTLLFAITVLPLPDLASGALSMSRYVAQTGAGLFLLYIAYSQLLVRPLKTAAIAAFNPVLIKLLQYVGPNHLLCRQFELSYLDLLTLCLESGMDNVQSLKVLQDCFKDRSFRNRHVLAASKVSNSGIALSDALSKHEILHNTEIIAFMKICEASGTLHSDMVTFIQGKKRAVEAIMNGWIRRISSLVYTIVVIYSAMKILAFL
jgi:type II secretory pathway component PulF